MHNILRYFSDKGSFIWMMLLFVLVVYCPFFLHLGDLPLRVWDEARVIANTLEMEKNGNFMVAHFDGKPEMWNTKPPFLLWCQLIFLKLIGNEELSFRLPSAIAGFLTSLILIVFFTRFLKDYWFGMMSVLVLVTANGYIGDHMTRTADYDAMLTFFMSFYAISFFLFLQTGKNRYLHFFFAGLFMAVFTKSIQGTLFLPALFIYTLISRRVSGLLKNKWIYIDFTLVFIILAAFYLYRDSVNPGYIDTVFLNEFGGRYLSTTEHHLHEFSYYLDLLISEQFTIWIMFVPLGFLAGLTFPKGRIRDLYIFVSILLLSYFLVISLSQTKLAWYSAPLFPFLAILSAFALQRILMVLKDSPINNKPYSRVIPLLFMLFMFYSPYSNIIEKVYKPGEKPADNDFYFISHLMQMAVKGKTEVKDVYICYDGYDVHLKYYIDLLNKQKKRVYFIRPELIKPGFEVIYAQDVVKKRIEQDFTFEETRDYYNVKFIKINGTRSDKN